MTEKQPAALRLAAELHAGKFVSNMMQNEDALRTASAEMLARQHARIAELEANLKRATSAMSAIPLTDAQIEEICASVYDLLRHAHEPDNLIVARAIVSIHGITAEGA